MEDKKKGALGLAVNSPVERVLNGLIVENPTLVLLIGMCPSLAITTCAINGIYMGLATTFVLALSNLVIALIRKVVPDTVRIPSFIVVIASFVTLVDLVMHAYMPDMYATLGVYIPLIVVNCIIFGRAEAYASKNGVVPSFFDGIGMGLGFTCAITIIGLVREIIGVGTIFSVPFMGPKAVDAAPFLQSYNPVLIFVQPPGAFLVLAFLIAIMNKIKFNLANKGKDTSKFGELAAEETEAAKKAEASKKAKEAAAKAIEQKAEKPNPVAEAKEEAEKRADAVKEEVKAEAKEEAAKAEEEVKES